MIMTVVVEFAFSHSPEESTERKKKLRIIYIEKCPLFQYN